MKCNVYFLQNVHLPVVGMLVSADVMSQQPQRLCRRKRIRALPIDRRSHGNTAPWLGPLSEDGTEENNTYFVA